LFVLALVASFIFLVLLLLKTNFVDIIICLGCHIQIQVYTTNSYTKTEYLQEMEGTQQNSTVSVSAQQQYDVSSEEQEMEKEALSVIFGNAFQQVCNHMGNKTDQCLNSSGEQKWEITLYPTTEIEENENDDYLQEHCGNTVGILLHVTLPLDYPERNLPILDITVLKAYQRNNAKVYYHWQPMKLKPMRD